MKTINDLTQDEFTTLLDEYFAPPAKRSKMSEAEIIELAKTLNERINVPIISETGEEKILIKIIIKIDRFLYDSLPNEFYDLIRDPDKGLADEDAKQLIVRLAKLANEKINIPYLPESVEFIAIRFVIGIIVNAARKLWDMTKAKELAENMEIPDYAQASDLELAAIVS